VEDRSGDTLAAVKPDLVLRPLLSAHRPRDLPLRPSVQNRRPLPDEVHVWIAELEGISLRLGALPPRERERAQAFLCPEKASHWVAARWALREVLARYLDQDPAAIELVTGKHGKPRLDDGLRRLSFNLSHSGTLALIAIAVDREVGVDIERIEPSRNVLALAERALSSDGAAAVGRADPTERAALFFALWTEHEARLKCLGTGIAAAPAELPPITILPLDVAPSYAAAVAVSGSAAPTCRRYSLD
jgi:phosphopantetheinyl transferase